MLSSRTRSVRFVFLAVLAALFAVILALTAQIVARNLGMLRDSLALERENAVSNAIASATADLAFERGRSAVLLRRPSPATAEDRDFLKVRRERSDAFLRSFTDHPGDDGREIGDGRRTILDLRRRVDWNIGLPPHLRDPALPGLWFREASALLDSLSGYLVDHSFPAGDRTGEYVPMALLRAAAVNFRQQAGKISSLVAQILAENRGPTPDEAQRIRDERRAEASSFGNVANFARLIGNADILSAFVRMEQLYVRDLLPLQETVLGSFPEPGMPAAEYAARSVAPLDSVKELLAAVQRETNALVATLTTRSRREIAASVAQFGALLLSAMAILVLLARRVASPLALAAAAVGRLTQGELETPVPSPVRRDEFGRLLGELELFRLAMRERETLLRSVREDEAWINLVLDSLPVRIMRVSRELRYLYVNRAFGGLSGLPRSAVIGRTVAEILGKDLFSLHEHHMKAALAGRTERYEVRRRANGAEFVDSVACVPHVDEQGNAADFFMLCVDVTERARLEERLNDLATRDPLTGALNRRAFLERAESELDRCSRDGAPLSFVIVDLDHFKNVNDTWGHAAGDEVLKTLAEACRRALRPADVFGRFGGEEFVALLPDVDADDVADIAERLRRLTEESEIATPEGVIRVTLSAGHTTALPGDTPDDLVRRADAALYESKHAGRNRVTRG
jgi:diguanylate cyclase (GGDEF)-like protein/PAS domain S-box-containing protein